MPQMQKGQRIKIIKSNIKLRNGKATQPTPTATPTAGQRGALDLTQLNYLTANFVKCN